MVVVMDSFDSAESESGAAVVVVVVVVDSFDSADSDSAEFGF